jgi:mRNA-degrading endonuclease YafQ of YafQ-DinJ toxin-antitoxin module
MLLHYTSHFFRSARKLSKAETAQLLKAVEKFENDPFSAPLKTHKLQGNLGEYWAFSVSYKLRVLFRFTEKNEALLYEVGGHSIY